MHRLGAQPSTQSAQAMDEYTKLTKMGLAHSWKKEGEEDDGEGVGPVVT